MISTKQKINTDSSTVAELVGVHDGLPLVVWTRLFLEAQGMEISDNVVYQDNQSAILLERNGKRSSGRRTRHIHIRYFSITDKIKNKELRVEHCPTDDMVGDFCTKPLNGSKFRRFRDIILGRMAPDTPMARPQECVGAGLHERGQNKSQCNEDKPRPTYAEAVKGNGLSQRRETR